MYIQGMQTSSSYSLYPFQSRKVLTEGNDTAYSQAYSMCLLLPLWLLQGFVRPSGINSLHMHMLHSISVLGKCNHKNVVELKHTKFSCLLYSL